MRRNGRPATQADIETEVLEIAANLIETRPLDVLCAMLTRTVYNLRLLPQFSQGLQVLSDGILRRLYRAVGYGDEPPESWTNNHGLNEKLLSMSPLEVAELLRSAAKGRGGGSGDAVPEAKLDGGNGGGGRARNAYEETGEVPF